MVVLTGILLSELSNIISTKAEMTLGPVPSWSKAKRCSGLKWENSSLSTNCIAEKEVFAILIFLHNLYTKYTGCTTVFFNVTSDFELSSRCSEHSQILCQRW